VILGIETSCDETAAALLAPGGEVLSSIVASQDVHRMYQGIVPEIASREHVRTLVPTIAAALREAGATLDDVRGIAVTQGPGLVGSLLVGVTLAKSLAWARGIPLVGVNHLEGHVLSPFLEDPSLRPPVIVLVVSGGHTLLVHVPAEGRLEVLGRTRDDAAGEAFDKVSVLLGLGYPGGAPLERHAESGDSGAFDLPRAMLEPDTLDFSFSGIKTAVRFILEREPAAKSPPRSHDLAASFQSAVVDVLVEKTLRAAERAGVPGICIAGGVAANKTLRRAFERACEERRLRFVVPRLSYCGDNAAMIAYAGRIRLERGESADSRLDADPSLPLGDVPNRAPRRRGSARRQPRVSG
jgi:N6-L-threonylcarbamoyladenine synthase